MQPHIIIEAYTALADLMSQMLAAAKQDDWENVSELEFAYLNQMNHIKKYEHAVVLDKAESSQKLAIIKRILADDDLIRLLIHPKMQQLNRLMHPNASQAIQTKLNNAYRM